jgi:hypothetical protein
VVFTPDERSVFFLKSVHINLSRFFDFNAQTRALAYDILANFAFKFHFKGSHDKRFLPF